MAAFRSLIVTCLARSTAWTTCCWCWGGGEGGMERGSPQPGVQGLGSAMGAQPPPGVGTPTSCDRNGMSCAQMTFSRLAISVCKERRRGTSRVRPPHTPSPSSLRLNSSH